jgi:hypothetical protein
MTWRALHVRPYLEHRLADLLVHVLLRAIAVEDAIE